MIFNNVDTYSVQESKYDANIAGGLMYMYENECNYNAMMKAVGISELRYYQETGKDLFLNEAGAISGFIEKAKAFFKKVIEKIKAIFHKFVAKINQFTMKNKDFVKKYSSELLNKDLTDFEFEGYTFPGTLNIKPKDFKDPVDNLDAYGSLHVFSEDDITKFINKNRGEIIGDGKEYDESDFHDQVKENLYGEKESIKVDNIRGWISIIANYDKEIKTFDNSTKNIVKDIENYIKKLEKVRDKFSSIKLNSDDAKKADNGIKCLNNSIAIKKALSQDYTYAISAVSQQLTDKCKQAKAICVKALGYKHESATLEGSYSDIFSGVSII